MRSASQRFGTERCGVQAEENRDCRRTLLCYFIRKGERQEKEGKGREERP